MSATVGKNKTTLNDIAQIVGLSPRAVSAALHQNGRISEESRRRVEAVAAELGYRPNIMARGLAARRTYLIGAIFPYVSGSFYATVLQGIEDQALKDDYRVVICSAGWNPKIEANHIDDLIGRGVDGLILIPRTDTPETYATLESSRIPYVQVFLAVPGLSGPSIRLRNEEGAYKATSHLIRVRKVRPYHLAGERNSIEAVERLQGFRRAIEEAGFEYNEAECVHPTPVSTFTRGRQVMRELCRAGQVPQAIFAVNDYAALGAMRAAFEAGLQVPRDLSIVGFDDLSVSSMQVQTPLTTVCQPKELVGELAVQMLMDLIAGHQVNSVELSPDLVIRESSGGEFESTDRPGERFFD